MKHLKLSIALLLAALSLSTSSQHSAPQELSNFVGTWVIVPDQDASQLFQGMTGRHLLGFIVIAPDYSFRWIHYPSFSGAPPNSEIPKSGAPSAQIKDIELLGVIKIEAARVVLLPKGFRGAPFVIRVESDGRLRIGDQKLLLYFVKIT